MYIQSGEVMVTRRQLYGSRKMFTSSHSGWSLPSQLRDFDPQLLLMLTGVVFLYPLLCFGNLSLSFCIFKRCKISTPPPYFNTPFCFLPNFPEKHQGWNPACAILGGIGLGQGESWALEKFKNSYYSGKLSSTLTMMQLPQLLKYNSCSLLDP